MSMAYSNQQGTAQEAGRPQPQTTVESAGGPFIRHSQRGRAPQYVVSGTALNGIVTQPLVARPGYFANFRVYQAVSGTTGTVTMAADAPYNLDSLITLKDAFGTPLIVADGYTASYLIGLYGGGYGVNNGSNAMANLPGYSAPSAAGNFTIDYALPLEFARGYGVLSGANASLLPTLQFNINSSSALYASGATTTATQVSTTVDCDFYWLPEGAAVEPPGLGTTRQWIQQQLNPLIASQSAARLQFPRLGGYLDTIILTFRDSTGVRVNPFSTTSRLQLYVDGVPLIDSTYAELQDDMWIQFGAVAQPTGVVAFSRKTSLNQQSLGLLDTGEVYLSTNPGTLLEISQSPWGTITNSPGTMSACIGQVVPTGAIIQGLPEL
jgi:hypothetical protein